MSEPTNTGKASATATKSKRAPSTKAVSLQLQRVLDTGSEPIAVFKTQKEGIKWLTENRDEETTELDKRGVNPATVRYQFARLLGKPKGLNVEVKVKLV